MVPGLELLIFGFIMCSLLILFIRNEEKFDKFADWVAGTNEQNN